MVGLLGVGLFGVGLLGAALSLRLFSSGLGGFAGMAGTGCTGRFTTSFFKLKQETQSSNHDEVCHLRSLRTDLPPPPPYTHTHTFSQIHTCQMCQIGFVLVYKSLQYSRGFLD